MQHVDEGRLHAWLDGELPGPGTDGARALERHLEDCAACRTRADEERRIRDAASAILRGADPGELGAPGVIPLSPPAREPARRADGGRRWVALGWAASVLLALGVGWLARPAAREQVAVDAAPSAAPRAPAPPAAAPAAGTTVDAGLPAATAAPTASSTTSSTTSSTASPTGAAATAEPRTGAAPPPVQAPGPVEAPPAAERSVAWAPPVTATDMSGVAPPPAPVPMPVAPPPPPPPPVAAAEPLAPAPAAPRVAREGLAQSRAGGAAADAATVTVRGQVTDERGRPLQGAQVSVPGLAARTVTGADGSYALSLPASRTDGDTVTVRVQQIGMQSQTRPLLPGRAATLDFALTSATVALEGLVVTGAGAPAAAESVAWRGVGRAEAERRLGRPLVTVPQLPLLGIELAQGRGAAAVRVRQRLQDGAVLSLVQRRAPSARARRGDALTRAAAEMDGARIVLEARGLVVEASAPLSPDSLRRLLAPVREP